MGRDLPGEGQVGGIINHNRLRRVHRGDDERESQRRTEETPAG